MRTYDVTITGTQPLLMHADNVEWADQMNAWKADPANKGKSKPGDDRTPAYRWLGALYHDGTHVALPSDNIMRGLMEGGAQTPTGQGAKTFKSQTQSGCLSESLFWAFFVRGKQISTAPLFAPKAELSFAEYAALAQEHGFLLYVKRAKVGQRKHIRVRPRFDGWTASGRIIVSDDDITKGVLETILQLAGRYRGLGDWRPGGKTPGPWGTFTAEVRLA